MLEQSSPDNEEIKMVAFISRFRRRSKEKFQFDAHEVDAELFRTRQFNTRDQVA